MREREEALAKFRQSLSRPMTERFYEEDELIDYFDFASDLDDDYLRMEALMCAARLYPDSEEMLQRKAIFYSQYSTDAIEKCLEDNQQSTGIIWDIKRAQSASFLSSEARKDALENIISSYDELTDEDIIQFVELVRSFDQMQWLKENLEKIEKKTVYPSVLLYETAISAEIANDRKYAIEILERLTDLEPFNADFWSALSKEYVQTNQLDKGLSALEYAIAIEPENPDNLYLKARILFMAGENPEEILSISKEIEDLDGMNREMLKIMGMVYQAEGEIQRAIEAYERFIHNHPEQTEEALLDMLSFNRHDTDKILDRLYTIGEKKHYTVWSWLKWAEGFEEIGANTEASAVIRAYIRNSKDADPPIDLLEISFRLGMFDIVESLSESFASNRWKNEALNIAGGIVSEEDIAYEREETDLVYYTISIITKLRLGKMDEVWKLAYEIGHRNAPSTLYNVKDKLSTLGFYGLLDSIIKLLERYGENYSWSSFDPFGYWNDGISQPENDINRHKI